VKVKDPREGATGSPAAASAESEDDIALLDELSRASSADSPRV